MNQPTSLGMTSNDEKRTFTKIALSLAVITCFLLPPLTTYAKDGAPTQEIIQKLEEAKSKAQRGHPKLAQKLVNTIAHIRAQLSKAPPGKAKRSVDLSTYSSPLVHIKKSGEIQVYIYVSTWGSSQRAELEKHGATIEVVNKDYGIVQAQMPYHLIEQAADLSFITRITTPSYGEPRSGSTQTEGDVILNADDVRVLGHDGSGVKVGVISDGVTNIASAQQSGDLPSVTVLQSRPGDEGTAMLEIVHDLAPGASLGFCGSSTSVDFIACISLLRNNFGADIIVDDLGYIFEPFFEDGPIAQTVKAAVDSGIFYTTATGNDGKNHYQETFLPYPTSTLDFHDFGGRAGSLSDIDVDFLIPPQTTLLIVLQWNEPFGGACSDYDMALFDQFGQILESSTDVQDCNDDPIEALEYTNTLFFTSVPAFLGIAKPPGSSNRDIELFYTYSPNEYITPAGSIYGHPAIPGVMAVGAIDANDPGNDDIETFSSRGPSEIFFPTYELRPKPDVTAIDGVSVTGAGGFTTPFFGTSAAAPHVAGVAALLMSADPTASATQISQAIKTSAVDLGNPGVDSTYGYGRIDALAALSVNPPTTPVDISGTIKTTGGLDICAMVLTSGQFMFSCNPNGVFSLSNLPRETDGTVKRQIYADGFFPKIDVLTGSSVNDAIVMTSASSCPSYNSPYSPGVVPGSAGTWIDISGSVLVQNTQTPICAMVLANGEHMFSCDGSGSYNLHIPLDVNGQFKLQVYADGFAPTIQNFDEFSTNNTVKMAYAVECQVP